MKKWSCISLIMLILMANAASAHNLEWQDSLRHDIDSLITTPYFTQIKKKTTVKRKRKKRTVWTTVSAKRNFVVGCSIYDLTDDSLLYACNDSRLMIPASTQKLYVALAMLKTRGHNHELETIVVTDGKEQKDSVGNHYWDGNIYVNATANPVLTTDDVMTVVERIKSQACDSVNGKIVLCQTDKCRRVKTDEQKFVKDIASQLMADGVCFATPKPWDTLAGHFTEHSKKLCKLSTPVGAIFPRMLKNSNNAYAETIFLNLIDDDENWSYDRCKDAVREMVQGIRHKFHPEVGRHAPLSDYYIVADGSGLSKQNKTTAQSQVDLLRYAYRSSKIFSSFLEYLPISGIDGTLSKRMTDGCAYGNIHAKTGTVNNVSTLSGYANKSNGHRIAFSILINECPDASFARSLQDKICEVLTR